MRKSVFLSYCNGIFKIACSFLFMEGFFFSGVTLHAQIIVETFEGTSWTSSPSVAAQSLASNRIAESYPTSVQHSIVSKNGTNTVATTIPGATKNQSWLWGAKGVTVTNFPSGVAGASRIRSLNNAVKLDNQGAGSYLITPVITSGVASVTFWMTNLDGNGCSVYVGYRPLTGGISASCTSVGGNGRFNRNASNGPYVLFPVGGGANVYASNLTGSTSITTASAYSLGGSFSRNNAVASQFTVNIPASAASFPGQLIFYNDMQDPYYSVAFLDDIVITSSGVQKSVFVDFGPNDVNNGNSTNSPDANGNYWTNLSNSLTGSTASLIDTTGATTGYSLSVTSGFSTNGILNGGLLSPDPLKLGKMAIATATQDYFFSTTSGALKISGLNTSRGYKFYCFGSRNNPDPARTTQFVFSGSNSMSGTLQTSGTNLGGSGYNGNNSNFLISDFISPNSNGEISIDISTASGGFAYLNMMKIEEWNKSADITSISVTGNDINITGASSQMSVVYSPFNATPTTVSWQVDDTSVASISTTGLLTSKKNGTVIVTASIIQNGAALTATKLVTISNQITELYLSGTATPYGDNIQTSISMNRTPGVSGVVAGSFELRTILHPTGSLRFYTSQNPLTAINYGIGSTAGVLQANGSEIDPTESGEVLIRVNLTTSTYTIYQIDTLKVSVMGSSVADGYGATSMQGYRYLFNQLLNQRYLAGNGLNWTLSNISIGGNSTLDLLNRWDVDLLNDRSKYVIYAVSLANEGIAGGGQPIFDQFKNNMLLLIKKARSVGKVPVIASNYPNATYGVTQYNYIKQMNLLIHEWDVPSINLLGAIDDGSGRWAAGYQFDNSHPNDAGHTELSYSIVPSLFDALSSGKSLPLKASGTFLPMGQSITDDQLLFSPHNITHSFCVSFDMRTSSTGKIAMYKQGADTGYLILDAGTGYLKFKSPNGGIINGNISINNGAWHKITISHFFARGETIVYTDSTETGRVNEKLILSDFVLNPLNSPSQIDYRDCFYYRSGMNAGEITELNRGKMLKSSLELYAPLDGYSILGSDTLVNLAQSTNRIKRVKTQPSVFIFRGEGNWDLPANWLNNVVPPLNVTNGSEIRIDPTPGNRKCILNVPVNFSNGSKLNVLSNAEFIVPGNLLIRQN